MGRVGRILGFALLAVELLGRYWHLAHFVGWYELQSYQPALGFPLWLAQTTLFWFCLGTAGLVALAVAAKVKPPVMAAAWLALLTFLAPHLYQQNRLNHGWQLYAMDEVPDVPAPCSAATLVWPPQGPESLSVWLLPYAFAATGSNLRCQYFGETSAAALLELRAAGSPLPDYALATTYYGTPLADADLQQLTAALAPAGYRLLRRTPHAALYKGF